MDRCDLNTMPHEERLFAAQFSAQARCLLDSQHCLEHHGFNLL
jgi:hypothetical protein